MRARAPGSGGSRCLVGCTAARNAPRTCGRKSGCLALALKSIDHGRVLGAWLLGFTNKAQPVRPYVNRPSGAPDMRFCMRFY